MSLELSDQEKELIRLARSKGIRPADLIKALSTTIEPKEEKKGSEDLLASFKEMVNEAMKMKLQLEVLKMVGLDLGEKEKEETSVDKLVKELKEILVEKLEKNDKISTSEMMNMIIMLKALGGEKSSDWKDIIAIVQALQQNQKQQQPDIIAVMDKIHELESKAKEEQNMTLQQLLQQLMPSQEKGESEDLEKAIGKEATNIIKEAIINTLKENLSPTKKIVNEQGKVDWGAVADKIMSAVTEAIKRIPAAVPPPPPREQFEQPPAPPPQQPVEQPQPVEQVQAPQPAEQPQVVEQPQQSAEQSSNIEEQGQ